MNQYLRHVLKDESYGAERPNLLGGVVHKQYQILVKWQTNYIQCDNHITTFDGHMMLIIHLIN
jgi:hypothetical protein